MICRTLLVCAAVFLALSTTVSSFSSNTNPSRGTQRQLLKGSAPSSRTTSTSHSALYAVKKAAKKKAPAKNKDGSDVVNFKKADFVSAVAEKTGMTKAESDLALAAVLNVIATVSCCVELPITILLWAEEHIMCTSGFVCLMYLWYLYLMSNVCTLLVSAICHVCSYSHHQSLSLSLCHIYNDLIKLSISINAITFNRK